jgi:beta-glucosidase
MTGFSLSRRGFLVGAAALSACPDAIAAMPKASGFPKGFVWGASTSALQIEGAIAEDGRGPSIWEAFARTPGVIRDGSSPAIACDHYHRWRDDIGLMKRSGLEAYRFSVAWPRVMPKGRGALNAKGLDFYDRLVDGLLAARIRPMACLYHWDLPQALQDQGGWMNRDIAHWFTDYALAVTNRLGDRVSDWFMLNEPSVAAIFGHAYAEHAPALNAGKTGLLTALHHQNLAQGRALHALRAEHAGWRLGTVLSLQPSVPVSDNPQDRAAAIRWDAAWNRVSLDGVMRGMVPDILAADMAPLVQPGDMDSIRFPLDMLGLNYYSPLDIQYQPGRLLDAGFGPAAVPGGRVTAMGWPVQPEGLFRILMELKTLYGNPAVFVTENGAAYDDHLVAGHVADPQRIAYLHDHLTQLARALEAGCDVRGYLVWSLLDNWEWQFGYSRRFGLTYVDYSSQRRTPKDSQAWYQGVARTGHLA